MDMSFSVERLKTSSLPSGPGLVPAGASAVATPPPSSPSLFVRLLFAISILPAQPGIGRAAQLDFRILSIDFNDAGQREKFSSRFGLEARVGASCAFSELNQPCRQGWNPQIRNKNLVWMPAAEVRVVFGFDYELSQVPENLLWISDYCQELLILNKSKKIAR